MKKIIVLVVLSLATMSALRAQNKMEPTASITSKFEEQFNGATDVQWGKAGKLFVANFHFRQSFRMAYYDQDGNLVAKGRKVPEAQLPMNIYDDLQTARTNCERKSGPLVTGSIYEFSRESGETEYVTTLENEQMKITLLSQGGKLGIQRKEAKHNTLEAHGNLIAKAPEN